jgi:hypothetical protein
VGAFIRQRLLNIALQEEREFQLMLLHYGIERLLFRLGQSEYSDTFILKGAMQRAHRNRDRSGCACT